MDEAKLAAFVEWAPYFRVVEVDGRIVGHLIGLDHSAPYDSPNFSWFAEHVDGLAYIDRIAVDASERGQGWGPALYRDFEAWAAETGLAKLCAEVNVLPPNPRSVRFHQIYGFEVLGEFEPTGSADYRVVMLIKAVEPGPRTPAGDGPAKPLVDWRSRVSTAGLIVGSAMIGLERVLFPEKEKDRTEQVDDQPLDDWPRLDFSNPDLDQLGPDEDGYWPT
jgi:predicted GNAT superfamily acetyltransferase